MPVIEIEARGPVNGVTLNRPEALNAMSPELVRALRTYFIELAARPDGASWFCVGEGRLSAPGWT